MRAPSSGLPQAIGKASRLVVAAMLLAGLASHGTVHPASAASDPIVAAAGDYGCDPLDPKYNNLQGTFNPDYCHQMATSDQLVNGNFSAVLALGDQHYCGSLAEYQQAYDPTWGRVKSITHPVAGNHEYLTAGGSTPTIGCDSSNAGAAGFFGYFGSAAGTAGQGWYSFDLGAWHLIALESNCGDVGGCDTTSAQGMWLTADLAAHQNQCLLAFWHIPRFSSGGRANANSAPFWQQLYAAHADVILNGHDHIYERFDPQSPDGLADPDGIREFIVGTGGANHTSIASVAANSVVRDTTTFGIMVLTLHAGSYSWDFEPAPGLGTFTDSGSAVCHNSGGPGALDHIVISPASATITAGGTQAYTAEGFDAHNNSLGDVTGSTTFSISGGGSCTGAVCTSSVAGSHTVTGNEGGCTDTATLHVDAGALDHIVISPASATITAGGTQAYTAEGFDAHDNSLGHVTGSTTFSIAPDGSCTGATCTATVAGPHTVTATDGNVTSTASLVILPAALDHLALSPASATISAGDSQTYTAQGLDVYGNGLGDKTADTTFSIAPDGSCTAAICTASVGGPHTVTGTTAGKTGTASLGVADGTAPTVTTPVLSPASVNVGGTVVVTASGTDGTAVASAAYRIGTGNWTTMSAAQGSAFGGPSVDLAATFTAPSKSGSYQVCVRATDTADNMSPGTACASLSVSAMLPGKPTGVTAVSGDMKATVSWTAPAYTGGSDITGYTATALPGGRTCTTTGALSCTIGSLANHTTYSITVTASNGLGTGPASSPPVSVTPRAGDSYVPLIPNRILDTAAAKGTILAPASMGKLSAGVPVQFQVTGLVHGDDTRNVPSSAVAVTGILSASNPSAGGWLAVSPISTMTTSNLNLPAHDARAAGVTVPLSATGTLWVLYSGVPAGNTAHVAFDITGYFIPGTSGATYHALTPNRIVDSRPTAPGHTHAGLASGLTAGTHKTFHVTGLLPSDATRNVPTGAVAVVGNLTVTNQSALGVLSLGPDPDDAPTTGTIYFPVRDNRATGLTVKLATDGTLSVVYTSSTVGATTDVIFDVTGYFYGDATGAMYVPITPNRIVDSRVNKGFAGPVRPFSPKTFYAVNRTPSVPATNIPTNAVAVTGTLTVTRQTSGGYLSLTTNPVTKPTTSTLNFLKGDNRATGVTAPLWTYGRLSVTFGGSSYPNTCQVVFDVTGYFVN